MTRGENFWGNTPVEGKFRSLKTKWAPTMVYRLNADSRIDIWLYLIDYYSSHTANEGLAPAIVEEKISLLSGIS